MRQLLLFSLLFLLYSSAIQAQYSRAIYTTFDNGRTRTFDVVEHDGTSHFVGLKESDNDSLRIVFGEIDDNGESFNYSQLENYSLQFYNIALTGLAANTNQDLVAVALTNYNGEGKIHYITLNTGNGSISNIYTLPEVFESVFVRTRVNGGNLITYIVEQGAGLVRLQTDIDNPMTYTKELIDNSITFGSATLSGDARRVELKVNANGTESVCAGNVFVQRTSGGSINSVVASNLLFNEFAGTTFETNEAGVTLLLSGKKYELLNASLTSVGSGLLSVNIVNNFKFNELSHDGNNWILYSSNPQNYLMRITLNQALSVVNELELSKDSNKPLVVNNQGGFETICAEQWEQSYMGSVDLISDAIIKLSNTALPKPFEEFGSELNHQDYTYGFSHLDFDFMNYSGAGGISYHRNGNEYSMNFISKSYASGMDENNSLYVDQFHNQPSYMSVPGPFSVQTDYDYEERDKYNRGYYVDKDMIETHLQAITNNDPNYEMPFGIREWPAHGDVSKGQAQDLAPFYDWNNNGIYEPGQGDYPKIYGTRCVLFIYHGLSFVNTPGIERHKYFYVVDCDTIDALNNSVFLTERIFARNGAYNNAYYSKWLDDDIGNAFDDYVGTNVDLGMIYSYNGDAFDEDNAGQIGFHDTLAATGMMFLRGVPLLDDGMDNAMAPGMPVNGFGFGDGIIDNETSNLESSIKHPGTAPGYTELGMYYMAQGLLPDGSPNTDGSVDIRFDYYGNQDNSFYASGGIPHANNYFESTVGNIPGDRQILGSSGEFNLDASNDYSIEFTLAFVSYVDTAASLSNIFPAYRLFGLGWDLKNLFASDSAGCGYDFGTYESNEMLGMEEESVELFRLYPNPANSSFSIDSESKQTMEVTLYTIGGQQILKNEVSSGEIISLDSVSNGVYLVKIRIGDSTQTKRLVVQ